MFFLCLLSRFIFMLVLSGLIMMYLRHCFLHLFYSDFVGLHETILLFFFKCGKFSAFISSETLPTPFPSFLSSETFRLLILLTWLGALLILFFFFSLSFKLEYFYSSLFKPTDFSPVISILVLSPSSEFFHFRYCSFHSEIFVLFIFKCAIPWFLGWAESHAAITTM